MELSNSNIKKHSYISGNGKPEKNIYISELSYISGKGRTLTYLELQAYSEPWYIQNPRHIQNSVKHLRWNVLALIFLYSYVLNIF